jgi:hypothetical protein
VLNSLVGRITRRRRAATRITASEPFRLVHGTTVFAVGETKRRDCEIKLGPGVAYPAPGWHTWTVIAAKGETWLLSAFFSNGTLIAVEYYVAKTGSVPKYAPRARGAFAVQPGNIGLGNSTRALGPAYVASSGKAGGVGSIVYQQAFEARWDAGVALISGNDGRIERIALYGGTPA